MKVLEMNPTLSAYSKKKATEIFKKGDELEVTITGVQPYGAFGVTIVDGVEYTTLIHRSIIKPNDKDVEPERHFRNGDKVKGVVQGFDPKGNMSFSTTAHFDLLPDYFQDDVEKEEIKEDIVHKKETHMTDEEVEVIYNQVKPTLEATLSVISAESEQLFKQMIKEVGVVEFCLSLGKIAPTFNIDPGLVLAEMIHNDIRGCL